MLALPPYLLLIPFALFLGFFAFFALANILSLAKYGARNGVGFFASFIFVCAIAIVLFMSWQSLAGTDWTTPVPLIGSAPSLTF
jgi:hypothetical protein